MRVTWFLPAVLVTFGRARVPLLVAAVMALSIVLRMPLAGAPLTVDEGAVAYVAYWWQRGYPLYEAVWVDRPQGVFLAYALGMKLLGDSPEALRLFGALYGSVTSLFVYLAGARLLGWRLGLLGAFFHALFASHPIIEGYNPNTELYMLLPATISAYWLLLAYDDGPSGGSRGRRLWLLGGAGAMACLAFLMKQAGVVALLPAFLFVLHRNFRSRRPDALAILRDGGVVTTGFLVVLAPSMLHGLLTAPVDYLDAVTHYRWSGASFWTYPVTYQAAQFLESFVHVFPRFAVFFVAAVWGIVLGSRMAFLNYWLASSFMGMAISGDWFGRYYIQLAPPLALIAAYGVGQLWERRLASAPMAHVIQAMAVLFGLFVAQTIWLYTPPTAEERFIGVVMEPRYRTSAAVAQYVNERTDPEDTIYVTYTGADIVYLSGRLSAEKHLFIRPLLYIPGAYDRFLSMMSDPERKPEYVVADLSPLNIPVQSGDTRLVDLLGAQYRPEATFPPEYVVYRRSDSGKTKK